MSSAYKYFWYPIPILLLIGIIKGGVSEFQLQYNYLVIGTIHLYGILSVFFFLSGLAYFVLRKRTFSWVLTISHIGMTTLAFLAYLVNRLYFPGNESLAMQALMLFVMLTIAGFLCYLVNVIWTLMGSGSRSER